MELLRKKLTLRIRDFYVRRDADTDAITFSSWTEIKTKYARWQCSCCGFEFQQNFDIREGAKRTDTWVWCKVCDRRLQVKITHSEMKREFIQVDKDETGEYVVGDDRGKVRVYLVELGIVENEGHIPRTVLLRS